MTWAPSQVNNNSSIAFISSVSTVAVPKLGHLYRKNNEGNTTNAMDGLKYSPLQIKEKTECWRPPVSWEDGTRGFLTRVSLVLFISNGIAACFK